MIKTYFARKMKLDPARIINVAVTPCTAKKFDSLMGTGFGALSHLRIP